MCPYAYKSNIILINIITINVNIEDTCVLIVDLPCTVNWQGGFPAAGGAGRAKQGL